MKKFIAKVNGREYVVELEEVGSTETKTVETVQTVQPVQQTVTQQEPKKQEEPAPKKAVTSGGAGSVKVEAPMPGTILNVKVSVGQSVKKNDVLAVLEAMKMENDIVAAQDGVIASVNVANGESVESGQLLVSMD